MSRRTIFIALAVAFLAIQSTAAAGFLSLLHYSAATHEMSRSQGVLLELESVMNTLTRAETDQRGYILTDSEQFLSTYRQSLESARDHLRRLVDLTEADEAQQRHLAQLVRRVDERMDQLGEAIVTREIDGRQAAGHVITANSHQQTANDIHRTVAQMRSEEVQRLRATSDESTAWAITTGTLSVVMFLLMFVVFGLTAVILSLALGARRSAPVSSPPPIS